MNINELHASVSENDIDKSTDSVTPVVDAPPTTTSSEPSNDDDWIGSFLESRGIQNEEITYGDGDSKKFSELEAKDKISILDQLTNQSSEYTENESGIINTLRDKDITFDELIEMEVNERMKAIDNDISILNKDYSTLSNEDAHYAYLRKKDPEKTTEAIEEEINMAKDMPGYDADAEKMKNFLVAQDKLEKEEVLRLDAERTFARDEDVKRNFAKKVVGMDSIGGWLLDEPTKDEMLKDIFSYDTKADNGNTVG